jgi:bifunctional DNase/RNase
MKNEIQVNIKGLVPTPTGCGVFLGNGHKVIAIFVDHSVAAAITMFLHKIKKPRPLTHDLIASILTGLGVSVDKVVINDLKDDTFFARLFLRQENELGQNFIEIDARPSDSMAIALQQACPIFVSEIVWEKAEDMTWALEQASQESSEEPDKDDKEEEDGPKPSDSK